MKRLAVALMCLFPLGFSVMSINDPYGPTEEGVNATIWALGGRNIIRKGWVNAKFGADLSPYWNKQTGGIYAHHPPLPVWLTVPLQALGKWDGWFRLAALLLAATSILFLYRTLRELVTEEAALAGVAVAATTAYVLQWGRMFTTLTLAAPLFMWLLFCATRWMFKGIRLPRSFYVVLPLTMLSSWDGVCGAGAVVGALFIHDIVRLRGAQGKGRAVLKALGLPMLYVACLGGLAVYFHFANSGLAEMIYQARYRAGALEGAPTWGAWFKSQFGFIAAGLGWLEFALLVIVPAALWFFRMRALLAVLIISSAPALGMTILMRHGAHHHSFWAYNLYLPASIACAGALVLATRWRPQARIVLLALFGLQALMNIGSAVVHQTTEHHKNMVGNLVKRWPKDQPAIRALTPYNFHPYFSWYTDRPEDIAFSKTQLEAKLAAGEWSPDDVVLADTLHCHYDGCRPMPFSDRSTDMRWIFTTAGAAMEACRPK